jgi:hypothetical protein
MELDEQRSSVLLKSLNNKTFEGYNNNWLKQRRLRRDLQLVLLVLWVLLRLKSKLHLVLPAQVLVKLVKLLVLVKLVVVLVLVSKLFLQLQQYSYIPFLDRIHLLMP